jgi:hypothetical protein
VVKCCFSCCFAQDLIDRRRSAWHTCRIQPPSVGRPKRGFVSGSIPMPPVEVALSLRLHPRLTTHVLSTQDKIGLLRLRSIRRTRRNDSHLTRLLRTLVSMSLVYLSSCFVDVVIERKEITTFRYTIDSSSLFPFQLYALLYYSIFFVSPNAFGDMASLSSNEAHGSALFN